jgi:hypothetical protein
MEPASSPNKNSLFEQRLWAIMKVHFQFSCVASLDLCFDRFTSPPLFSWPESKTCAEPLGQAENPKPVVSDVEPSKII